MIDGMQPAWRPDGRRIAFERNLELWTSRGDGTRARRITPVRGGVGPMPSAMLLRNTLEAARAQAGEPTWT